MGKTDHGGGCRGVVQPSRDKKSVTVALSSVDQRLRSDRAMTSLNGDSVGILQKDIPFSETKTRTWVLCNLLSSLFHTTAMSVPFVKTKGKQEEAPSMDRDELLLVKKINYLATLRWPYLR